LIAVPKLSINSFSFSDESAFISLDGGFNEAFLFKIELQLLVIDPNDDFNLESDLPPDEPFKLAFNVFEASGAGISYSEVLESLNILSSSVIVSLTSSESS